MFLLFGFLLTQGEQRTLQKQTCPNQFFKLETPFRNCSPNKIRQRRVTLQKRQVQICYSCSRLRSSSAQLPGLASDSQDILAKLWGHSRQTSPKRRFHKKGSSCNWCLHALNSTNPNVLLEHGIAFVSVPGHTNSREAKTRTSRFWAVPSVGDTPQYGVPWKSQHSSCGDLGERPDCLQKQDHGAK